MFIGSYFFASKCYNTLSKKLLRTLLLVSDIRDTTTTQHLSTRYYHLSQLMTEVLFI